MNTLHVLIKYESSIQNNEHVYSVISFLNTVLNTLNPKTAEAYPSGLVCIISFFSTCACGLVK